MDEKDALMRWVHESEVTRLERIIKRLWILCIIIFLAFVISNGLWIYYESQWEVVETSQSVEQDIESGDGDTIVTGIGDVYGASEAEGQDDHEEP